MNRKSILWTVLIALWGILIINEKRNSQAPTCNLYPATSNQQQPLPNHLSLIPTSPRWKYPFKNHNAFYNDNEELLFPKSTLPIISISINEEAFFDYFNGIYIMGVREWEAKKTETPWWFWPANYRNRGKKWQRDAAVTFIGFKNKLLIEIAGIRINGNATRGFPQKSLRLVFKDKSGMTGIENLFFPSVSNSDFVTMILRNAGNDWDRGFMRDVLVSALSQDLAVETQPFAAVNVFLNGEYWGIHYLRPKVDQYYLSGKYDTDVDNISMIESPGKIYRGSDQGLKSFNTMVDFAQKNDLSDSIIYLYISEQMDIDNFIDYVSVNMIVVNTDWPQNNWLVWKNIDTAGTNQKWQWIIKDTDYGLGFFDSEAYTYDMLQKVKNNRGPVGILFRNLMANQSFNSLFQQRFKQIISQNWKIEHVNSVIDSLQSTIQAEMPYQINRWRTHLSIEDWENEVDQIRGFYFKRNLYLKGEND